MAWSLSVKVGDIVTLKEEWQVFDIYYGLGVITLIEVGEDWTSYRVQWNDDFLFHQKEHLELVSESR